MSGTKSLTAMGVAPIPDDSLHAELRSLIASSRQRLAGAVNAELTRLYWTVGERLRTEVLGGTDRAQYGDQLMNRVGEQLAQEFGRGFEAKNLRRMVQFAQVFAQPEIVATLSRQLSWSHFVNLLPLKTEPARQFYAQQAATNTWSVRELRQQIERKAFERTELAALQYPATVQTPTPVRAESVEALATSPAQPFKDLHFQNWAMCRPAFSRVNRHLKNLANCSKRLDRYRVAGGFCLLKKDKLRVKSGCSAIPVSVSSYQFY